MNILNNFAENIIIAHKVDEIDCDVIITTNSHSHNGNQNIMMILRLQFLRDYTVKSQWWMFQITGHKATAQSDKSLN